MEKSKRRSSPSFSADKKTSFPPHGIKSVKYQPFIRGEWFDSQTPIVEEAYITVFANGQEVVTMMATPYQQEYLAVGYLYTEGLIQDQQDILNVDLAPNGTCVDVWLRNGLSIPERGILTSGCGRGITYRKHSDIKQDDRVIQSDLFISHRKLFDRLKELQSKADLYHQARGIHASGLATNEQLIISTEDVGRHNTIDKLAGQCILDEIEPADHILLTTGRVSSEMISKAHTMGIPVVASRTSPTSLSIEWANRWGITLVGYLRHNRMNVFSHPRRLK